MSNKVLIEFVADTTSLDAANSSFEKLGESGKKVMQEMNASLAKNTNEQKANTENIDKTTKSVQNFTKAVEQAEKAAVGDIGKKAMQDLTTVIDANTNALAENISKAKELGQNSAPITLKEIFEVLAGEVEKTTDDVVYLQQSIELAKIALDFTESEQDFKQISDAIIIAEQHLEALGETPAKSSMRAELRANREELAQMLAEGKITTAEIYKMAQAGGELKDALGDANDAISAMASDTFAFDATIQGIQSISAGFQVAQGAAALFGVENEELQKTLVKLNALMAITSGLQQLQNNLQKTSAQSLGMMIWLQKAYNIVVGQSTGVMKLFRIALASTGIGLLVILLGTLIANWDKVTKAISNSLPFIDKFKEKFGSLKAFVNGVLEGIKESLTQVGETLLKIITFDFKGAYESGKGVGDAFKKGFEDEVKKTNVSDKLDKAIEQAELKILQAKSKGVSGLKLLLLERNKLQADADKLLFENQDKNGKEYLEKLAELADNQKSINSEIKANKDRLDSDRIASNKKALDAQKTAIQDEINALEIRKLKAEENSEELLKIEKDLIDKKAGLQKLDTNSKSAKELIDAQAIQKKIELEKQFNAVKIEKALETERKIWEYNKLFDNARINEKLQNINLSNEQEYQLRVQLLENQRELDELEIAQSTDSEEVKIAKLKEINTKFLADKNALYKKSLDSELQYSLAMYDAESAVHINSLNKIKDDESLSFEDRKKAVNELTDHKLGKIDIEKAALEKQLEEGLISNKDYGLKKKQLDNEEVSAAQEREEAITALIEAENEKRKALFKELGVAAIEQAEVMVSGISNLRRMDIDNELNDKLNSLSKQREIELSNTSLTESQKAAIEKRYKREENELKRKAFEQKKKLDRTEAILNTAVAMTKAFAQLGPIGGAIASAMLITKLGFELATIDKQKFPGFRTGTKNAPSGFKWVGEDGPELIYDKGGYPIITNKDSMLLADMLDSYGIQHDIMNGHNLYDDMVLSPNIPSANSSVINNGQTTTVINNHDVNIDYDKMAKVFASEVAKNPSVTMTIDKNGFNDYVTEGKSTKINKNTNYN